MLILVCGVVSLTALWEAVAAGRAHAWIDLAGYVALAVSTALFAVQATVTMRRPTMAERLQSPAVYLTLIGIFMLLLSHSDGRRL